MAIEYNNSITPADTDFLTVLRGVIDDSKLISVTSSGVYSVQSLKDFLTSTVTSDIATAMALKISIADIYNGLDSTSTDKPLSANQGKALNDSKADKTTTDTISLDVASIKAKVDAILDSASADYDTFAEIVALINSVDTENDSTFSGYAVKTDAEIASLKAKDDALNALKVNTSDIVDSLEDASTDKPLSAKQGNVIKDSLDLIDITKLYSDMHVSVWDTRNISTGSSDSNQIKLPIDTGTGSQNFRILWGDGSSWQTITDGSDAIHTYDEEGVYTIYIIGTVNGWKFADGGDKYKITDIKSWGKETVLINKAFFGCSNLTISASDLPTLSNIFLNVFTTLNVSYIPNISIWDTSSITTLETMFAYCIYFNQDLSAWNTSSVTKMNGTFYKNYHFDQDLGSWDISNVTTMDGMFHFTALSDANYQSMIKAWAKQGGWSYGDWSGRDDTIQQDVPAHFGSASLTGDAEALDAKAFLTADYADGGYGWVITDGE